MSDGLPEAGGAFGARVALGPGLPVQWRIIFEVALVPNHVEVAYENGSSHGLGGAVGYSC
ncbi:hypothetical protein [Sorangium sp. So ce693]|uniref:hypothetical protein n=1 Tax=Sorangium sp. So ce693 TaxID=3133318 RepID=UPI003F642784